jgi:hypothetical protein
MIGAPPLLGTRAHTFRLGHSLSVFDDYPLVGSAPIRPLARSENKSGLFGEMGNIAIRGGRVYATGRCWEVRPFSAKLGATKPN